MEDEGTLHEDQRTSRATPVVREGLEMFVLDLGSPTIGKGGVTDDVGVEDWRSRLGHEGLSSKDDNLVLRARTRRKS